MKSKILIVLTVVFPTGFPLIIDVTWTASQQAGSTLVVSDYTGDALEDLFKEIGGPARAGPPCVES
jgi:hypothetical protein